MMKNGEVVPTEEVVDATEATTTTEYNNDDDEEEDVPSSSSNNNNNNNMNVVFSSSSSSKQQEEQNQEEEEPHHHHDDTKTTTTTTVTSNKTIRMDDTVTVLAESMMKQQQQQQKKKKNQKQLQQEQEMKRQRPRSNNNNISATKKKLDATVSFVQEEEHSSNKVNNSIRMKKNMTIVPSKKKAAILGSDDHNDDDDDDSAEFSIDIVGQSDDEGQQQHLPADAAYGATGSRNDNDDDADDGSPDVAYGIVATAGTIERLQQQQNQQELLNLRPGAIRVRLGGSSAAFNYMTSEELTSMEFADTTDEEPTALDGAFVGSNSSSTRNNNNRTTNAAAEDDALNAYVVHDNDDLDEIQRQQNVEDEYNIKPLKEELEKINQMSNIVHAEAFEDYHVDTVVDIEQRRQRRIRDQRRLIGIVSCFMLTSVVIMILSIILTRDKRDGSSSRKQPENPYPKCFETRQELFNAIDSYMDDDGEGGGTNTTLAEHYGYPMNEWCVRLLTDFSSVFSTTRRPIMRQFTENISEWDVSNAISMSGMFNGAEVYNGDLSKWNVSKVEDMSFMFLEANNYDDWDVSSVINMTSMLRDTNVIGTTRETNSDISTWNVSRVIDFSRIFSGSISSHFIGNVSNWDVSNAIDMSWMFKNTIQYNGDLSKWNVSNVIDMSEMFYASIRFSGGGGSTTTEGTNGISNWDVSNVQNANQMFLRAVRFNANISTWNVSSLTNAQSMFRNANAFNHDLCTWGKYFINHHNNNNTNEVITTTTTFMFDGTSCSNKSNPDLTTNPPGPFCAICR